MTSRRSPSKYLNMTRERAEAVRKRYAVGDLTQKQVAALFGIAQSSVCRIVLGDRWFK